MSERDALVWLGVVVVCVIVEALTAQLISIWFVAGGIAALIACLCGVSFWWQLVCFLVVSTVALATTRPLVKKLLVRKRVCTNADRVIGMTAVVTEEINNSLGLGQVNVSGSIWSARSVDQSVIVAGSNVQVQAIQGVKLMVLPLSGAENDA
ncbi:MAG: NfeD family protein [Acutalibacteraceae bacterium]|jgi:membrane protein implicated in regulation of membrane protease activity